MAENFLLGDLIGDAASRHGGRIAVESSDGLASLTYRALSHAVDQTAAAIAAIGTRGDRVLVVMDGCPDWPVSFFGVLRADRVAVPVSAQTAPDLVAGIARLTGATTCVIDPRANHIRARLAGVTCVSPGDLAQMTAAPVGRPASRPDEAAVLAFTSGTTSRPRVVTLSHANLVANLRSLTGVRHTDADEALLSVLPPSHLFELVAGQLAPLALGARIVYAGPPLPNRLVDAIRERRVTRALLVPALVEAVVRELLARVLSEDELDAAQTDVPAFFASGVGALGPERLAVTRRSVRRHLGDAFRSIAVGGAALAPVWFETLRLLGIDADVGYGLTEAGPLVSLGSAADSPPGSVGRPLPGVEVRIDAAGEILVHGAGVMTGYVGDAEATAAALDRGWLHTGDSGRIDERGFLYLTGRLKEAIVPAGGETVFPDEIEPWYVSSLFAEHCVVGVRGPDGNDTPTLVVVPASREQSDARMDLAISQLRRLAPTRCRVIAVVRRDEPLPRTPLGKVRRRELAADLEAAARPTRRASSGAKVPEREVREIIAAITKHDTSLLSAGDDLVERLGVDSLQGLQILAMVESRFGVRLPDEELIHLRTIGRITTAVAGAREGVLS